MHDNLDIYYEQYMRRKDGIGTGSRHFYAGVRQPRVEASGFKSMANLHKLRQTVRDFAGLMLGHNVLMRPGASFQYCHTEGSGDLER